MSHSENATDHPTSNENKVEQQIELIEVKDVELDSNGSSSIKLQAEAFNSPRQDIGNDIHHNENLTNVDVENTSTTPDPKNKSSCESNKQDGSAQETDSLNKETYSLNHDDSEQYSDKNSPTNENNEPKDDSATLTVYESAVEEVIEERQVIDAEPRDFTQQPILPKRYILLFMLFLGFAIIYALRVNLNVAIVAMVNNKTFIKKDGRIVIQPAEFHWNSHTQANVVGSFYYGYWVLQVPGAWIALKMGATRIFGYGVLLASLMSILTPVATRYHVMGLVCVRVVQGVFLGVTFPCVIAIWARWAPPLERSTMVTMAIAGSPVGNIIAIPLTGILAKYGFDGGWPSVFYFFGFLGLLWYGLWEYIVYDSPDSHPSITDKEKRYINKTIGEKPFDPLKETLPLCAIFTSVPMWGIIIGHFGACWGYYTLFTQMPTYLKDIQHLDIKTMGMVAATPYILKAFLGPVGGISADMILKYNYLSVRGVRVLFYALGCISAGFFIMMTGYFVRKGEAIAFLILGVGFSGLNATGYAVNHLDLAPRYAGVLMGVTNTFATMPGFLSPLLTGYIASNKKASEWRTVFWITFIVYIVCTGLYSIMCSGEKQWWAEGAKVKLTPESETGMVDKSTETEDSVSVAIDDIESQSAEDSMQNKKDKTD